MDPEVEATVSTSASIVLIQERFLGSTTTSILFFSGRGLLTCLNLLGFCQGGSIIFCFSLLYFLLFCHAHYGLSLGPCSPSPSTNSFSSDLQNQSWFPILGIDLRNHYCVVDHVLSIHKTDVFASLRYVMVDQSSIILFILRRRSFYVNAPYVLCPFHITP